MLPEIDFCWAVRSVGKIVQTPRKRGYSGHGKSPVLARFTNYTLLVVWGNFLLVSLWLTREFRTKFKDSPLPHVLCLMTKWYQMTVKWLSNDYEWLRNSSPNVSETDLHWSSWTLPAELTGQRLSCRLCSGLQKIFQEGPPAGLPLRIWRLSVLVFRGFTSNYSHLIGIMIMG